jgi:ABC-type uncharacterized transport system involved in gliding motility auxiliary subunit
MKLNRQELFKSIGFLGAGLLIAGYLRYTFQEIMGKFNASLLIAGGVLLLASLVLNFSAIRQRLTSRSGRLGANTTILGLAVIAIFGLLNFVGYRHHKRFDLTTEKLYSLSDQTRKVISGLQTDVKVLKFSKQADQELADRMAEYRTFSKHISYEHVDPQSKPEVARQYKAQAMDDVVVAAGDRTERLTQSGEQDLTNAILKVTRDKPKTICFIEGHGEKQLAGGERDGYSTADKKLKDENYQTKAINLVSSNEVPPECSVVVDAGPTKTFFPQEAAMIGKYLDAGGKVMLLVDPETEPGLSDVLKAWNIGLGKDLVLDVSGVGRLFGTGPAIPMVQTYGSHPITRDMTRIATFFPEARSVSVLEAGKSEPSTTELLKTTEASWAETNLDKKGQKFEFNEGQDRKGPINLGVAASKTIGDKEARLVVIGDSDFASNAGFNFQGNGDLFLNTVNWLAQDEDLIAIRPKNPADRKVTMTDGQQRMLFWFTVLLMPLAVIGTGAYVWWKRR